MAKGPLGLELPMRKSAASVATAVQFKTAQSHSPNPRHTHTKSIWERYLISLLHANLHLRVSILGNPILFSPFLSGPALHSPSCLLLLYLHRLGLRERRKSTSKKVLF